MSGDEISGFRDVLQYVARAATLWASEVAWQHRINGIEYVTEG